MSTQARVRWLKQRRRGIGGSDAAAILGVSEYRDAWSVYVEKAGLAPIEEREADHLVIGHLMEPVIASLYTRRTGRLLEKPKGIMVHPDHDCIIANPDRLVKGEHRGTEIKTAGLWTRGKWGEAGTDQVPPDYLIQCSQYMAVTGYPVWDVPVLFHGSRFEIYVVPRDIDLERWMLDRLVAWWQRHIVGGIPPEIDGSDGCAKYLALRYPQNNAVMLPAPPEAEELAQRLAHLRGQMDVLDRESTQIENSLKAIIGDADGIEGGFGKIAWRRSKDSKTTDWEKLARMLLADLPDEQAAALIAAHEKTKPGSRRFVPTFNKPEEKSE